MWSRTHSNSVRGLKAERVWQVWTDVNHADALEIRATMRIEGPLALLWRKLVAEGVAKGMPAQTEQLVEKAVNG